jgi:hypothetical protein
MTTGVDVRQLVERQPGRQVALRSNETERRRALGEDRVGQDVGAARLDQRAGVADPRQRRHHRRAGDGVAAQEGDVRDDARRRLLRRLRHAGAGRFHAPRQQRCDAFRLELDVVVLESPVAVMRRGAGREVGSAHGERSRAQRR